ncbi:hypothetical protein ACJ41O_001143 [Fusarium nematophilum]
MSPSGRHEWDATQNAQSMPSNFSTQTISSTDTSDAGCQLAEDLLAEDLVPQGDLILMVGKEKKIFRVPSTFLCDVSPVFAAMLGPHFAEGHRLRSSKESDTPMALELSDDDPQAVYNACRVLYGAHPSTKDLEPASIHNIAVFADKYDMVSRFTFASAFWFAKYAWVDGPQETWWLTTAAFWLENRDAFYMYSRKLVKQLQTSHLRYAGDAILGLRLCLAIEELRVHRLKHNAKPKGLCLDCFKVAKDGFVSRVTGCPYRKYH